MALPSRGSPRERPRVRRLPCRSGTCAMKMKIYGDLRSGNCDKVRLVAGYLRHPYDWVETDILKGDTRTAEFLAMNPQGQVPVLALPDGRSIAQSGAIMRYLANGTPLMPDERWTGAQ